MSESIVSSLKHTICAQHALLQKLHNELDAEREASATAASEALSVIFRLQGEKATVKMEAEQYKRFSDEKMSHAEASLALSEDVIYQKEMEISALDSQVQAYRHKLLSMGCCVDFRDDPFQENEGFDSYSSSDGSCLRELDCMDTYSERIKRLDFRVEQISNRVAFVRESKSDTLRNGVGFDYPSSPRVHDVFQVPEIHQKSSSWEPGTGSVSESEPGFCLVNETSGINEVESQRACKNRDEEMKMLSEIKERLNSLQEELRGLKVEKPAKRDMSSLRALSEAMLCFWI